MHFLPELVLLWTGCKAQRGSAGQAQAESPWLAGALSSGPQPRLLLQLEKNIYSSSILLGLTLRMLSNRGYMCP